MDGGTAVTQANGLSLTDDDEQESFRALSAYKYILEIVGITSNSDAARAPLLDDDDAVSFRGGKVLLMNYDIHGLT